MCLWYNWLNNSKLLHVLNTYHHFTFTLLCFSEHCNLLFVLGWTGDYIALYSLIQFQSTNCSHSIHDTKQNVFSNSYMHIDDNNSKYSFCKQPIQIFKRLFEIPLLANFNALFQISLIYIIQCQVVTWRQALKSISKRFCFYNSMILQWSVE